MAADDVQGRIDKMTASNPVSNLTQLGPNRYGGYFNEEHSNSIAVANGVVYVADMGRTDYGDTPPCVASIPLGGNSLTPFTALYTGSLPGFSPRGVAVSGNTIYLTNGNQILEMPTTGGTPTVLVSDSSFGNLDGLTYFDNALYVTDNHTTSAEVWKVDLRECTSTSVSSSSNASVYGQSVTFTATVSASSGFDNLGTVTFSDGSTSLGTASLSDGQATYSIRRR